MKPKKTLKWFALLLLVISGGCASVEPWEMSTFGLHTMRADRDPVGDSFSEHVYFTREASSGGRGVGGGGCGCN